MDNEGPIEQNAEALINTRFSLLESLGKDWKEKSIFPNIEIALKDKGLKTLNDGQEVSPSETKSDLDQFIVEANAVFRQNNNTYHARRITDEQGKSKVFIVGKVGKDILFQTADYGKIYTLEDGRKALFWAVDTTTDIIGLVSGNGQVLRIDKALQLRHGPRETNNITFIEYVGEKSKANLKLGTMRGKDLGSNDTLTLLPENHRQMGILFHEIGHLLRERITSKDAKLDQASQTARNEFDQILKEGSPINPQAKLSLYQVRKITVNEERGAWAMGISFIKGAGGSAGLDSASPQAIKAMMERSEEALAIYDKSLYSFSGQDEAKPIPAFSQEMRKLARILHREIAKRKVSYSSLPSFDKDTGENLANNPKRVLTSLPNVQETESKVGA